MELIKYPLNSILVLFSSYGDISPKTHVGRFIAIVWMFISMAMTSMLTASLTEALSNKNDLILRNNSKVNIFFNSVNSQCHLKLIKSTTLKRF